MSETVGLTATTAPWVARVRDYLELSKSRIVFMVVMTTAAGYFFAGGQPTDLLLIFETLVGTAFVAAGTNALNQYVERDLDAKMNRTRQRPLPAARMTLRAAMTFSLAAIVLGTLYLAFAVNMLAAGLALATLFSYLFLYTPLKRRTSLSTIVGAVPGAIPPMIGCAAASGTLDTVAWLLFGILFLWQLPHFLAIGWMYREDYARAGFCVLAVEDPDGGSSGRQALIWSMALLLISILPIFFVRAGGFYLIGALGCGTYMIVTSARFARAQTMRSARQLFFASIVYLPLIMSLLVLSAPR